jgi:tetratricopeptide (TPR) repeat protein
MLKIPYPIRILLIIIGVFILAGVIYNIPFVNDKLAWRVDEFRQQIVSIIRPPEQAVFVPVARTGTGTLPAPKVQVTSLASPTKNGDNEGSATPSGPILTPTITATPLPVSVSLPGVKYVDQNNRWNYCGPSNLTMALNFWGWKGNRDDVAKVIKPGENNPKKDFIQKGLTDKNVMPYEMVDFVNDKTEFHALSRYGGSLDLLKNFIAAGYPVLTEKGYYERDANGKISWMGHYQFITAYDNKAKVFTVQDTYLDGPNFKVDYDKFQDGWRDFNYIFLVIYPADREAVLHNLLGEWADAKWANQHALEIANEEVKTQTGINSFFAWFNKGTSHVQLQEYVDAADAYDQAFAVYATLGKDDTTRPYRMMWYQTGPYWAYYYTGRYQDVINLATTTLSTVLGGPTLEESLYWRAMGEVAAGLRFDAIKDFQSAVYYNKNFPAAIDQLKSLGAPLAP